MLTLALDTSAIPLSVAVINNHQPLATIQTSWPKNHSVTLMPAIAEVLKLAQVEIEAVDQLIVAAGPGSYTGVRIAVTTAKTLAWTLNKPVYAISSLRALTLPWRQNNEALIIPLIDARRAHFFAGCYQWQKGKLQQLAADAYLDRTEIVDQIKASGVQQVCFGGQVDADQQAFFTEQLPEFTCLFADGEATLPRASEFDLLIQDQQPVADLNRFAPTYLRKTEAEVNWLAQHPHEESDHYVEQV
ncbi:tRNA (adenosine(37)-N6)-threonylcarbamoyltransferase complex dimerization subunit type 1 TsaB [Lapidilactobacillus bayanensis]|uniref:tRNA (adenosine(37)-N6)-threonylcarbamoyltransferase complex dimerization subunit type 1 TsaB n=1 Tax=Lapidilactobacillus bayanensis TaxID=2485998 RepID=UPI0013DE3254|nr:tRNA (adenosine(37)-N6)-threonylcarbamoyltransferase complex dimerization subunit type 1 TsaB [Lapidilactobacillus bayanensis]